MLELEKQVLTLEKKKDELYSELAEMNVRQAEKEPYDIYEIAELVYGVDPVMIQAIERLESNHYRSELFRKTNNTYGGNINGEYIHYDSREQSTLELARLLKFNYINKGLDTVEKIAEVYCPDTPEEWATQVSAIYGEIQ